MRSASNLMASSANVIESGASTTSSSPSTPTRSPSSLAQKLSLLYDIFGPLHIIAVETHGSNWSSFFFARSPSSMRPSASLVSISVRPAFNSAHCFDVVYLIFNFSTFSITSACSLSFFSWGSSSGAASFASSLAINSGGRSFAPPMGPSPARARSSKSSSSKSMSLPSPPLISAASASILSKSNTFMSSSPIRVRSALQFSTSFKLATARWMSNAYPFRVAPHLKSTAEKTIPRWMQSLYISTKTCCERFSRSASNPPNSHATNTLNTGGGPVQRCWFLCHW
mmetsp:Transcript_40320/g.104549  ORF Transcript_40320/g.104549 Transcript_40320/m.104549 type:complete len:283 (-) Transcript_40320:655-1503(-)